MEYGNVTNYFHCIALSVELDLCYREGKVSEIILVLLFCNIPPH
jgi:hypothetical protein